jgi:iron complex transport system ATP-binding protein
MSINMLDITNLRTGYHKKEIVHGVSFSADRGDFLCIIGANGCGKTTMLKGILGLLPLMGGEATVDGVPVTGAKQRAKIFAYIPQIHSIPFPFRVSDVVLLGRTPHLTSTVSGASRKDKLAAYAAMEMLGIEKIAGSVYTELSGGQQQLVLIARALAQEPRILIMDEPTASLDFGNQQMVLSRMRSLGHDGMLVIMVTHDPSHVLMCANRVLIMKDGRITAEGTPSETVTSEMLSDVFGVNAAVVDVAGPGGEVRKAVVPA